MSFTNQQPFVLDAENVQGAGCAMRDAAESMRRSVGELEESLQRQRMFMDEWLARFEQILSEERSKRPS